MDTSVDEEAQPSATTSAFTDGSVVVSSPAPAASSTADQQDSFDGVFEPLQIDVRFPPIDIDDESVDIDSCPAPPPCSDSSCSDSSFDSAATADTSQNESDNSAITDLPVADESESDAHAQQY